MLCALSSAPFKIMKQHLPSCVKLHFTLKNEMFLSRYVAIKTLIKDMLETCEASSFSVVVGCCVIQHYQKSHLKWAG